MKLTPLLKLGLCLVLLLSAFYLHPLPAFATCSACLNHTHSISCWSTGATCADAQASLAASCEQQATDDEQVCGPLAGHHACDFSVSTQSSCYQVGSLWKIDATGIVGCQFCGQ